MLTDLYIEALLVDENTVREAWGAGAISDEMAAPLEITLIRFQS